jgi:p-aminobenzoyl-glutamate transporter AbgT
MVNYNIIKQKIFDNFFLIIGLTIGFIILFWVVIWIIITPRFSNTNKVSLKQVLQESTENQEPYFLELEKRLHEGFNTLGPKEKNIVDREFAKIFSNVNGYSQD